MAGSITARVEKVYDRGFRGKLLTIDWVTDATGACSGNSLKTALGTAYTDMVAGRLWQCETIPGANGDKATFLPTSAYTLTMLDPYGADLLFAMAARSTSVAEIVKFAQPYQWYGCDIVPTISGAGAQVDKGRIILFLENLSDGG
jgi:hypothetical protein